MRPLEGWRWRLEQVAGDVARNLRGCWRLLRVLLHAAAGWMTIVFVFPRLQQVERDIRVQDWARHMLHVMGITLDVHGEPPAHGPALLVSNHVSWLDILVLHAVRHCRFVAKSEVRHWAVVGTLSTGAGTLYIERQSRRDAMRVVHRMAESLQQGEILAVFPEGTTTHGGSVLPFHANLIQAAVAADAPVVPVGMIYCETVSGRLTTVPAYVDDDSLAASVWRTLSGRDAYTAWVRFGTPQRAAGRDRRTWAADLREAVSDLR